MLFGSAYVGDAQNKQALLCCFFTEHLFSCTYSYSASMYSVWPKVSYHCIQNGLRCNGTPRHG